MVLGNLFLLTLFDQGVGLGDLARSLPTSAAVQLCSALLHGSRFHQVISLQSALA